MVPLHAATHTLFCLYGALSGHVVPHVVPLKYGAELPVSEQDETHKLSRLGTLYGVLEGQLATQFLLLLPVMDVVYGLEAGQLCTHVFPSRNEEPQSAVHIPFSIRGRLDGQLALHNLACPSKYSVNCTNTHTGAVEGHAAIHDPL